MLKAGVKMNNKKLIIVLALSFALLLGACGKSLSNSESESEGNQTTSQEQNSNNEAYELSKEAYDNITIAYDIIENLGEDIYQAAQEGAFYKKEVINGGTEYLAKKLKITKEELAEGIAFMTVGSLGLSEEMDEEGISQIEDITQILDKMCEIWENASEGDKNLWRTNADLMLIEMSSKATFQWTCADFVIFSYVANSQIDEAKTALDNAKSIMKQLSNDHSDYEHYTSLKDYYSTTSAFYDFCLTTPGNIEQFGTTLNEYRNDARKYRSEIEFAFED